MLHFHYFYYRYATFVVLTLVFNTSGSVLLSSPSMPLNFRPWRTKKYNVSTKNSYVVCVHLLDNQLLECTLTAESTGHECLENIAQRIELAEVFI